MSQKLSYKINTPPITHDTFDQEVIIIDLNKGTYYSLEKAGAAIWQLIQQGCSCETIIRQIQQQYKGDPKEIEQSVVTLIEELEREEIISPVNYSNNCPAELLRSFCQQPFIRPILNKYNDFQNLLTLDPIHEVNEEGWPCVPLSQNINEK